MNTLNYHHLLYFWTVVREGRISRAAEKLRVSQPTISAQLKLLEDSLAERRQQRRVLELPCYLWAQPLGLEPLLQATPQRGIDGG